MLKKLKQNIIFLFMLFIIPLTIGNVDCAWVYYEAPVKGSSLDIKNITLGEFVYNPNLKPGFPDTEDGNINNNAQDELFKPTNPTDPTAGLDNAFSNLNFALTAQYLPKSNFISSVDKVTKGPLGIKYSGEQYKEDLGLADNINFVIQRLPNEDTEEQGKKVQYYYIYTTTFDISKIKVNKNGKITADSPKVVYDVYRVKYKWKANRTGSLSMEGKYTRVSDGQIGYADSAVNKYNNEKVGFFDPNTFVEGQYKG